MDPKSATMYAGGSVLSIDASRSILNPKALHAMKMAFAVQRSKWIAANADAKVAGKKRTRTDAAANGSVVEAPMTEAAKRAAVASAAQAATAAGAGVPSAKVLPAVPSFSSDDWRLDSEVKFDDSPMASLSRFAAAPATNAFAVDALNEKYQPLFDTFTAESLPELPRSDEFDDVLMGASVTNANACLDLFVGNSGNGHGINQQSPKDSDVEKAALAIALDLVSWKDSFVLEGDSN